MSLHEGKGAERASAKVSVTLRASEDFRVTDSRLMGVHKSWGYYWTQGDFCRVIFSVLFTGIFLYLVHLMKWGDETSERPVHKWLKWKISTNVAEKRKGKEMNQSEKLEPIVWGGDWFLRTLGWAMFSRALSCHCAAVSLCAGVSQGLVCMTKNSSVKTLLLIRHHKHTDVLF